MIIMSSSLQKYFETFFEEKDLPIEVWDINDDKGRFHIINSEIIIQQIIESCGEEEQKLIRTQLVKLDFANQPILPYLKHLAQGFVNAYP